MKKTFVLFDVSTEIFYWKFTSGNAPNTSI